jgi:hypothetical protein
MHTDKFFSENASRFEHKDFVAVRLLVELLESEHEPSVVLVRGAHGPGKRRTEWPPSLANFLVHVRVVWLALTLTPDTTATTTPPHLPPAPPNRPSQQPLLFPPRRPQPHRRRHHPRFPRF